LKEKLTEKGLFLLSLGKHTKSKKEQAHANEMFEGTMLQFQSALKHKSRGKVSGEV
jgi:hypothetical protein